MSTQLYIARLNGYNAALGNHADVARWTYTVPAGKRAVVHYVYSTLIENIASAVITAYPYISATINGVTASLLFTPTMNAIAIRHYSIENDFTMYAGDSLVGRTYNASGNTLTFRVGCILDEYQ